MDPATGAISRLLPKLDELQKNMREEVASLEERLTIIQSALRDVDDLPSNGWSSQARDLSYDIEHVVDKFRARQLRARQLRADDATAADRKDIIAKIIYKMAIDNASRRFATEFRGLSDKLSELIEEQPKRTRYTMVANNLDGPVVRELRDQDSPVGGEPSVRDGLVGELSIRDSSVVGLHGRVEKLVNILMDQESASNQQLKVASILGMPGVGKTTLANQVYRILMPRFECSAWVSVSTDPDIKHVLRNMLSQITLQGDANFGLSNIKETIADIRKALKDKRYFIVFDDMCDNKAWEIIKSALVDVTNSSVVLMTTRKVSVARYACGTIYRLKSLSDILYKKLLTNRLIIGSRENSLPQLANIPSSSRVLDKSSGIPSAIIHATNSLLAGKALEDRDTVVHNKTGVYVPSVPPRVGGTPAPDTLHDRDDPVVGQPSVRDGSMVGEFSVRNGLVAGKLIGLHSRVEKLVNILTDEGGTSNRQLKVASILGMPSVGKTTLANQVYRRLMRRFDCSAWVTVSTNPDVKNVLRNLLSQITLQGDANFGLANIEDTIGEIQKSLKDKRYFIVFDDMCDNKAWEIIKYALVDVGNFSAVLMTSRKVSVARYACGIIYRLKSLSDLSSKRLLNKRLTIGSGDNYLPQLAKIHSRVLEKNTVKAPEDGDTVVDTKTGSPSVLPRVGGTRAPDALLQGPSVYTVPRHLKPCLMYLSMFQKGHEISTDRLVWGWIAEGFIPGELGMTLREQGESYLSDLISRGFLVAIKVDASGKPRSCRLPNDDVHRSITSLSAEENSVTILDGQQVTPLPTSVRRLSIQGNNPLSPQVPLSRVRSLVVSVDANSFHQETGGTYSFLSLMKFENLSVLDLGSCPSLNNDHLKGIESLLLLKYLVLGGDCITNIPRQIGSLVYLQTLDLRASRVRELPESIAGARNLECLLVNRHTTIPDAIGKMKALEVLGDINISRGKLLEELRKLPALKVLSIVIWSWDDTYDKELFRYLGSLRSQKIQTLSIITCCSLDFLEKLDAQPTPNQHLQELEVRHSAFLNLPKWISSLAKLSSLSIEVHKLSQTIIEMLGELDTLSSLFLTSKHDPEPECNFRNGFTNLTSFRFVSSALGMIFVPGGMLKLERLHLSFQASLTKDFSQDSGFGLENLSSLKHIHVEIICFNASGRVVQDIEKAITRAIQKNHSGGAELVIDEVRKEDMEKNEDGQETQGCSPVEYFDLIKKFSSDQRQAMEEVGFGDLLKMKCVKIRHELCKRLAEAYDISSEAFNIRTMLQMNTEDVGLLMGIPSKGKEIVEVPKLKNLVLLNLYADKNGRISLDTLQDYLSSSKDSDEHFIRRVLLYTIGMLLCPTTQRNVSSDYLNLLENVEEIKTVNWASLTLHHLKDSLKKYKTGKSNIEGNLVLLQIAEDIEGHEAGSQSSRSAKTARRTPL